jgi:hypothetical protein
VGVVAAGGVAADGGVAVGVAAGGGPAAASALESAIPTNAIVRTRDHPFTMDQAPRRDACVNGARAKRRLSSAMRAKRLFSFELVTYSEKVAGAIRRVVKTEKL